MQRQFFLHQDKPQLTPFYGRSDLLATSYSQQFYPGITTKVQGNPEFTVRAYKGDDTWVIAYGLTAASIFTLNGKEYFLTGDQWGDTCFYNLSNGRQNASKKEKVLSSKYYCPVTSFAPYYDEKHFFVGYKNGLIGFYHYDGSHKMVLKPGIDQPEYKGLPVYIMFVDFALHYIVRRQEGLTDYIEEGGTYSISDEDTLDDIYRKNDEENKLNNRDNLNLEDWQGWLIETLCNDWAEWYITLMNFLEEEISLPTPVNSLVIQYARDSYSKILGWPITIESPTLFKPRRATLVDQSRVAEGKANNLLQQKILGLK